MPLSWNEIKSRAFAFAREWADETSEEAEAKSFWDGFFNIFGINRRRIASFEYPVVKSDGKGGFIDLLWKGILLIEHKSRGKDLNRAAHQAFDYFSGLKERDLPRYVLVSDFARFRLYDLETDETHEFTLAQLHENTSLFGFVAGYQTRNFGEADPVNVQAAERLGALHDQLADSGYVGHELETLLVRLLFCLFAEDTGIFPERDQFRFYLENRILEDGSNTGSLLEQLFQTLNMPEDKRQKKLDEDLAAFPYVNGALFAERLPIAAFDSAMFNSVLDCAALDWSRISPAIFGSLFQSIMDKNARRNLGAHYTSEKNILRALHPLFLDALRAEFMAIKNQPKKLLQFHEKLARIEVLDPACGCGNFLVIAYRELRKLELDTLRVLYKNRTDKTLNVSMMVRLDVDSFHGMEIGEFPAQIAQVALWLTDHQMNLAVSQEFGQYFARLPLKRAPHIIHGNALTRDWAEVVTPEKLTYIVGNPPFVGVKFQSVQQRADIARVFADVKDAGLLDYVACWYKKSAEYMQKNPVVRTALVSTNSITQGEQIGILWRDLLTLGVKIHFAYRTFQWRNEGRHVAAVHCVIIGFGIVDSATHTLFECETIKSEPLAHPVTRINPYLVEAPDLLLQSRNKPICNVPEIQKGNIPVDNGHLIIEKKDLAQFLENEPNARKYIRRLMGATEFIHNKERYCLWLTDADPAEIRTMPLVMQRIEQCRRFRRNSPKSATRKFADDAMRFMEIRQPDSAYILIPRHSSEKRNYIPLGFMDKDIITTDANSTLNNATLYHFGILTSIAHMAWVRAVCGRIKSDYRYSNDIVYNNFPWPDPAAKQKAFIEAAAQAVLDTRAHYPNSTLADLYDPLTMPTNLQKAHHALNGAVDQAYGKTRFASEAGRVAFLFARHQTIREGKHV
ncbi:MAG: N-6 DNA methylase [Zoogloeaceae bacterium]|jgi:hypothetical protein|nr:N-6 DNA methylase [Zoogloeaceae bacterium]